MKKVDDLESLKDMIGLVMGGFGGMSDEWCAWAPGFQTRGYSHLLIIRLLN